MNVRLIEHGADPGQTREIRLNQEEFLIGRGTDCDLRLRMHEVSRHHCIIHVRPGDVSVLDLGSSNGTYLNGQRVRSQATLHTGDELRLGDAVFLLDLGDQKSIESKAHDVDSVAVTRVNRRPLKQ